MIKGVLAFVMITYEVLSIGPTPTVGIFVYDLPDVLQKSLPTAKYFINASHTKWLETHSIRFVPIDPESSNLTELLPTLNGIFIPGGIEIYNDQAKLMRYKEQLAKVYEIAQTLNKDIVYPVFATGFGAQLLFQELIGQDVPMKAVGTSGKSLSLTFNAIDESVFYKTAQDINAIKAGIYPINTNFQISMEDFKKNDRACSILNPIATSTDVAASKEEFLMFFELKTIPVYGFFPDIEMIQFNHADQGFADKSLKNMEAAFQMVKFFARLLNKNPNFKAEAEVLALKNGWSFHSSAFPTGEFEDILWK